MAEPKQRHNLFGIYQSPQGDKDFRELLAAFLKKQFGWNLSSGNITVPNGSQSAFFVRYNMLAGDMPDGSERSMHLPLAPVYLGYADIGLSENFFTATRANIELLDDNLFKYHIDFSNLRLTDNTGAMGVCRPTNPAGNVLTDAKPYWNDNPILALRLSKLGLPGARAGFVVANEEIIRAYTQHHYQSFLRYPRACLV